MVCEDYALLRGHLQCFLRLQNSAHWVHRAGCLWNFPRRTTVLIVTAALLISEPLDLSGGLNGPVCRCFSRSSISLIFCERTNGGVFADVAPADRAAGADRNVLWHGRKPLGKTSA